MDLFAMMSDDIKEVKEDEKKKKKEVAKAKADVKKKASGVATRNTRSTAKTKVEVIELPVMLIYAESTYQLTEDLFVGKSPKEITTTAILEYMAEKHYPFLDESCAIFKYVKNKSQLYMSYKVGTKGVALSPLVDTIREVLQFQNSYYYKYKDNLFSYLTKISEPASGIEIRCVDEEPCEYFSLSPRKIDVSILQPFLNLVTTTAKRGIECFSIIYYDKLFDAYFIDIPTQKATSTRVKYELNEDYDCYERYSKVMDLHSHHIIPHSFSPTDDNEDRAPYLHLVVYNVDPIKTTSSIDLRLGVGYPMDFLKVLPSDVFNLDGSVS